MSDQPELAAGILHDRKNVRMLQHAHADQIESQYRSLAAIAGNPQGVVIRKIGNARTFIAAGHRLENRAIFNGEETVEQIDEVLAHFAAHRSNCVIEVNPANYYVDPPRNWEQRLLKHLVLRGCFVDGFRCVWRQADPPKDSEKPASTHRIERFGPDQADEFQQLKRRVEGTPESAPAELKGRAENTWINYIAFDAADIPCAVGTLYADGTAGFLAWWFTHPAHRRHGLQQMGIHRRVRDALDRGCRTIFTVTDFNFSSPANLQRCGFRIAYNYLLVRKEPDSNSVSR